MLRTFKFVTNDQLILFSRYVLEHKNDIVEKKISKKW